ncbi:antibiotic biosynthesis monooxygenase family protein [Streptomyces coelicoflavus]|uniref:antibiotic biosynthesis monooxygenase family protein n=1 Tax=Streptomyces coelicoflavus TaxID=285562 RepID=UPI00369C3F2B
MAAVRVLLWHRVPAEGLAPLLTAYHEVSARLAGLPGLVRNELLVSPHDPDSVVIASEWADLTAYRAWEDDPAHRDLSAPLRPFRDPERSPAWQVLEVVAEH